MVSATNAKTSAKGLACATPLDFALNITTIVARSRVVDLKGLVQILPFSEKSAMLVKYDRCGATLPNFPNTKNKIVRKKIVILLA